MLNIEYKKGNLFANLKEGAIHLHACNGQGKWGPVIAEQFKKRFPNSYLAYSKLPNKVGEGYILEEDDYKVGCLITSKYYGKRKDPPKKILVSTYLAVQKLLESTEEENILIQSPKINAGKFATPWDKTEEILIRACEKVGKEVTWIVWELD